jgi:predicted permease
MSNRWLSVLRLRLRTWMRRDEIEQELDEELGYHLERQIEANREKGMSPSAARTAALRAMGGVESPKERCREAWHIRAAEEVTQDVRYAVRTLRRSPMFAAIAVISLALGIGANTALFSFLNAVLLERLPVHQPDRLVLLGWKAPAFPELYSDDLEGDDVFSKAAFDELRREASPFSSTFAFATNDAHVNVGLPNRAESVLAQGVSGSFFGGLGVRPLAGRLILDGDDSLAAVPVAVVSAAFWQRALGGELAAIGRAVTINNQVVTVVGVAPPEFFGLRAGTPPDLWIPLSFYMAHGSGSMEDYVNPRVWWLTVLGRLKPGVTPAAAEPPLRVWLARSLAGAAHAPIASPSDGSKPAKPIVPELTVSNAERGLSDLRKDFSKPLLLLMAMVGLVLLIACTNVASLLLAKANNRQPEIATRTALGASSLRIVRQLLIESLLIAVLGAGAGLLVAAWLREGLSVLLASGSNPIVLAPHFEARTLLFTAAAATLSGLLFGLAPALRLGRRRAGLDTSTRTTHRTAARAGRVLVVGQVALGLVLLMCAGLCVRSLDHLLHIDLGFDQRTLISFRVQPGLNGYADARLRGYYQELERRIATVPGVRSVGASLLGPVETGWSTGLASVTGVTAAGKTLPFYRHLVDPGYFDTLGLAPRIGRLLGPQDLSGTTRVAVVNERFVHDFMPGLNPLGHRVHMGKGKNNDAEIIGLVRDVRAGSLREPPPASIYLPYQEGNDVPRFLTFTVRSQGDPRQLISTIARTALALDPNVPLSGLRTESEILHQALFLERTFALLTGGFGTIAVILACIGLYGTLSYSVSQRRHEFGIRMALGAGRATISRSILRETLMMIAVGIAVGVPAAWGAGTLLESQLFGLSHRDPLTLGLAVLILSAATVTAGWVPARQASVVDPARTLRAE